MAGDNRQETEELVFVTTGTGDAQPQQTLTPQQLLVVAGIITGLLEVDSIIVDRDGQVDIVLKATFGGKEKRKTKL